MSKDWISWEMSFSTCAIQEEFFRFLYKSEVVCWIHRNMDNMYRTKIYLDNVNSSWLERFEFTGVHSPLGQLSCIVDAGILNRPCGILFEKETGNIYVTTFTAPCGRRGVMKFDRYADSLNAAATICPDTEYTYLHVNGAFLIVV